MIPAPPLNRDRLHDMFIRHGLRCTQQRRALYETLASKPVHPTADQIFQELCEKGHQVSLATVYNTLESFCRAGLAQKIPGDSAPARYDANVGNHLHMWDRHTGAVADVPDALGDALLSHIPPQVLHDLESQLGFKIEQIQIGLVGRYQSPAIS